MKRPKRSIGLQHVLEAAKREEEFLHRQAAQHVQHTKRRRSVREYPARHHSTRGHDRVDILELLVILDGVVVRESGDEIRSVVEAERHGAEDSALGETSVVQGRAPEWSRDVDGGPDEGQSAHELLGQLHRLVAAVHVGPENEVGLHARDVLPYLLKMSNQLL